MPGRLVPHDVKSDPGKRPLMGRVAGELADFDPEFVRGHLRRLFWLLNDRIADRTLAGDSLEEAA